MEISKKYPFVEIGLHTLIMITVYSSLYCLGIFKDFPRVDNLSQWDTGWYTSIVQNGYSYIANAQCNIAFFPLFPYLWKWTQLSTLGISILNYLFLCTGIVLLYKGFDLSRKEVFLLLSTPSLFFCYVPYSESLFFLSCSIFLYSIEKENTPWTIIGLSLACLTRSVSILFIPGIIFSWLLLINTKNKMSHTKKIAYLILTVVTSTLIVNLIQYIATGVSFKLFEVQVQWGHLLSWPEFPLTTWDGVRLLWLDGLAFYVGFICSIYCCYYSYEYFFHKKTSPVSAGYLFSLFYLAASTLVILFYSGKDANGGTSIYSLNRYIFATPFFSVFLLFLWRQEYISKKYILAFILSSIFCWSLFGLFGHLHGLDHFPIPFLKTKLYFLALMSYTFLYVLIRNRNITDKIWYGIYIINIVLQLLLLNSFIQGKWIG